MFDKIRQLHNRDFYSKTNRAHAGKNRRQNTFKITVRMQLASDRYTIFDPAVLKPVAY